ncbi:MAG TPA: glycosyltransferase family 2 protein [Burkholderiales bacterium]|nr:glycosyltransferase family 2 protein [Burkholderiales bacterium]
MSEPKVIIGLPVYNGQKYLGAAIESHLSQSFGDFHLVISDNGSTDATPEICADYASKDKRLKYLRSPENRGILWNHRRVLDAIDSPNQYFRWAGADDLMESGLLQVMVEVLNSRPEVEAVVPGTKNIDDNGKIIGSMATTLDLQSPNVFERARQVLVANYQHVIAYGLLRASTLRLMRTGPDYIGWDPVFVWELALRGQLIQPSGPGLLRRFHPGSISRVKTVKEMRKWVEPNSKAGMNFPHWTWAYERARALIASPMSTRDRLRIGMFLARYTSWQRAALVRDVTQAARRTLGLSDEYTF